MALRKIVTAAAIISTLTNATPTIDYPLNSQVPTVARISQPFAYTFPSSTFSSSALPITYSLASGPGWLKLDSVSRTISGTPSTGDFGPGIVTEVAIGLTATDSTGSVTLNSTLVVSKDPAPVIAIPPSVQLPSFGIFSGPSTILFHPSTPFDFKFDSGTFSASGGSSNLSYYAVTADNTPLPSWILFDGSSLTFSGRTPDYSSLIQPPQTFGIRLIVTDVANFAGASIVFYIEVGVHLLSFINADMFMNVTAGSNISFNGLWNNIQIDGRPASTSEISSIRVQTPPWLEFDNSTMTITGIAPTDVIRSSIPVLVTDMYGDITNATIMIAVSSSIFSRMIPDLNATAGASFSYDLSTYLSNSSDIYMTANFTPPEPWLSFEPLTFILAGQIPAAGPPSAIGISLTAVSKTSHISSSQSVKLSVASARPSIPGSPSRTSESPTASRTASLIQDGGQRSRRLTKTMIAAIVVPILVLFVAVLIVLFCYRRRRRAARSRPMTPPKTEISAPLEARERISLSSVEEIVLPPRVAPPDPLQLDTSGFGDHSHHAITTNEKRMNPEKSPDRTLRRSRTTASMSRARMSDMTEPESSRNRVRSYSENALSKTNTSWRSTQESAYPTIRSSHTRTNSSHRLTRTYSNYSRKGRTRRSARVPSANAVEAVGKSANSSGPQSEGSILNLRGSSFSLTPLENFSALSRRQSAQDEPEPIRKLEKPTQRKPIKRQSYVGSTLDRRRSGIGHGARTSISSLSSKSVQRRSVGHGQEWMAGSGQSPGLARNSRTWLTVGSTGDSNRQSNVSALSEYSDTYAGSTRGMSIRQVTKSPSIVLSKRPSQSSQASRSSRPVSRRIGSSPFFGGNSARDSRFSPKKVRMSYADSPTVPEEPLVGDSLENVVVHGLREEGTPPRDSFGISYGLAREGTRQLRSFIQGQLHRTKTKESIRSTQTKDSRFESAVPSLQSLHQSQHPPIPTQPDDDEHEDYDSENFSEGSWETHPPSRDSQGNPIEYSGDESPEVSTAARVSQAKSRASIVPTRRPDSKSFADPAVEMGPGARMVPGAGRRPISVDAKATKGSVRGKVERHETDYSAYI